VEWQAKVEMLQEENIYLQEQLEEVINSIAIDKVI